MKTQKTRTKHQSLKLQTIPPSSPSAHVPSSQDVADRMRLTRLQPECAFIAFIRCNDLLLREFVQETSQHAHHHFFFFFEQNHFKHH